MKKIIFIALLVTATNLLMAQTVITVDLPYPCSIVSVEKETLNPMVEFDLIVSPNPNDGWFTLSITGNEVIGKAKIQLFNTHGVCVLKEEIYSGNEKCIKQIGTGKLPPGLYSLTVDSDKKTKTVKVLISKNN